LKKRRVLKNIIKRRRIFNGRLIKLYSQRHRFPGGYIGDLEVVIHPGAVLIVPFLKRDKIILIRQYRPVINSYIWELPAGTLDKNESPAACAKRELIEETGYSADNYKRIGFIYPAPGYTTEKIFIFEARKLKKVEADKEEDEVIRPRVFYKKEIENLLKSGRIVDAKTICALRLARVI